jgi:hypothetical protein
MPQPLSGSTRASPSASQRSCTLPPEPSELRKQTCALPALTSKKTVRLLPPQSSASMQVQAAKNPLPDGKGGPGASTITIFGMKNCGGGEWKETREYRHSGPNGDPVKITSNMSAQEAVEEYQKMLRDERTIVLFPSNSDSKDDECE